MEELVKWLRDALDQREREIDEDCLPSGEAAWVRADVDSKRRILDAHRASSGIGFIESGGYDTIDPACTCCGTLDEYAVRSPCYTVRLLALPEAWRPGYREEWKP